MEKAGIYLHIPFCRRKCDYCSFVSTPDNSLQDEYLYRLKAEIDACEGAVADTVYIGGGTPSTAFRGFLTQVCSALKRKFDLDELKEFTIECNPESVSFGFLSECKTLGVNRLSLGLQSADDEILKSIGRVHTVNDFITAVKRAKSFGIDNISGDLILGLPKQTEKDIENAIELFASLDLSHVSVYSLSVEKGTPLFKSGYKPDDDYQSDLYEFAVSKLKTFGYDRYEVSNFARNGKRAVHNTKYWTGADYYGFGVSAHSLIKGERIANVSSIKEYLLGKTQAERTALTVDDEREEFIMLRLRVVDGLSLSEYERRFSKDLLLEKKTEIDKLLNLGLVKLKGDRLKVEDKGVYLLNSIITELI